MELNEISGVGPKTLNALNKLHINSVNDLINYYPYKYEILKVQDIKSLGEETGVVTGKVESNAQVGYIKRNLNRLSFRMICNNLLVKVVIFNRAFLKNNIIVGKDITLIGKYNKKTNTFTASDIKFYKLENTKIEPKYHMIKELKSSLLTKIIAQALNINQEIEDYVPLYLSKTYEFLDKKQAVLTIHQPHDLKLMKQAKLRLVYEELFEFMFKINYLKYKNSSSSIFLERSDHDQKIDEFINSLEFVLTPDQTQAVNDIKNDFLEDKRMNRLVLGDVGSGKTIVSFIAMYINYLDNYQSALMAPTEILAKQHYEKLVQLYEPYNINVALLIGSMKANEKKNVLNDLKEGNVDVLVGTHAILNENLEFNNLGLVITDEQHRFGVNQRSALQNKGQHVDVIYMSATPIPRTYALTLYGDMDTSIIKTKPSGRKDVVTKLKKEKEIPDVLYHILEELKQGHQVYVVAPSIEETEENDLQTVENLEKKFKEAFQGKVKIGVLHGKLKAEEKEQIMVDFKNKEYNILISTTVIEVGIDVGNATMMIIFNAERFGLATLHQLRGRVGRNSLDSYCYLISNYEKERLKVLEDSNDGFYISQKDFELRKEGDLFGEKQSGDMAFKIANLSRDYKILVQAKKDSEQFLQDNISTNFINYPHYQRIIKQIDFID